MRLTICFRLALFIPVILALPVVFWPGATTFFLFQIAVLAIVAAAMPYAIFVIVMLLWSINKPDKAIVKAFWWVPAIFAGVCFLYFLLAPQQISLAEQYDLFSALFMSTVALLYAYFCVLIAFAIWTLYQLFKGKVQI